MMMFNSIKVYLYGIAAAVMAILVGMYNYRGHKLKKKEEELEDIKLKDEIRDKVEADKDKVEEFEANNRVVAEYYKGSYAEKVDHTNHYSI